MDACTVTAFGVITAFAVPNPGSSLATLSVFSGSVVPRVTPLDASPSLLWIGNLFRSQPFRPSTQ